MDTKRGVLRAAILTTVVLLCLSISPLESALAAGGGSKKICSFLGDDPKPSILDQDIFKFNGTKGEKVTVTLEEDSAGSHTGKQASLFLMDEITRTFFFRTAIGALPRTIAAVLPSTGKYLILVAELPGLARLESFRGAYCLTLTSSAGAHATLTPTPWVEPTGNSAPVANAGPDQTVLCGAQVYLDGSKSTDADGDALTHKWSTVSKPAGSTATLSDPSVVKPTFVVDKPGTYVAQLIVNDGKVDSAPDTVSISTENSKPIANAGPDQTAFVTQTVTLDGSRSSDVDGDPLTDNWSFTSIPSGSGAALSNPSAVKPTFVVDKPGTYVAQLIVNDGKVDSAPDTVSISTENSKPIANAGPDQTVYVTDTVQLDGSKSSDMDGDPLTYNWSLTSVPSGSAVILSDPSAVKPTFVVDKPGTYVAQLIVSDGVVNSAASTVAISTQNSPPVANAGPNQTVYVTDTVQLDGSKSTDVDGDLLSYKWSFTSAPSGSAVILSDPSSVKPTFVVDKPGTYVAQLIVNDGVVKGAASTVTISTQNSPPVANAGLDQTVYVTDTVQLDGSKSSDVDGDPLIFWWSFTSTPSGSLAKLSDPTATNPTFVVNLPGIYVVQLIVNDGKVDSAPKTVAITTANSKPVAEAGPEQTVYVGDTVQLDGSASRDADRDPLSFFWSIISKPDQSTSVLSSSTEIKPTFVPDLSGLYVAQLIVNDDKLDSDPDTSTITANLRMVTVPSVVGLTQAAAQAAIIGAKLNVGAITQANSAHVPAGSVISQSPVAGTSVTEGSSVSLVISIGPAMVAVPNVAGMTQQAATSTITSARLSVGTITQDNSATVPVGSVISQSPIAATSVAEGSPVSLVISMGPVMVTVPNVVNLTQAAAQAAITGAQLTVGTITQSHSATVPAGSVISQTPPAGSSVPEGSPVDLVVSLGPVMVLVPDVTGMARAAAQAAIQAANLQVGAITAANSSTVPVGSVISQSPSAGSPVAEGSSVSLVISSGPVMVTVPNVVGMAQDAAQTAITAAGLSLGGFISDYSDTIPLGSVISQSPTGGLSVGQGSPVYLVISIGPLNPVTVDEASRVSSMVNSLGGQIETDFSGNHYSLKIPPSALFEGKTIDPAKWRSYEFVRDIKDRKLHLKIRTSSIDTGASVSDQLNFLIPEAINTVEVKVTPNAYSNPNGLNVRTGIFGEYYNDSTANGWEGEVSAGVTIGGNGNTLVASWGVSRHTHPTDSNKTIYLASDNFTTPIILGATYTLSLSWDGTKFTFKLNNEEATYTPTTSVMPAIHPARRLQARTLSPQGKESMIEASFDDVVVSPSTLPLYDDFSSSRIDKAKWQQYEFAREIQSGQLRLKVRSSVGSTGPIESDLLFQNPASINAVEAKVTPLSFDNQQGVRGAIIIGGRFFNDGTGSPGAYTGDIFAQIVIGGTGTIPVAYWTVLRHTHATDSWQTDVIDSSNFALTPDLKTQYTLSIAWDGSQFTFRITDGVNIQEKSYAPGGTIMPANMPVKLLSTRVSSNAGREATVEALFDDVKMNESPDIYDDFSSVIISLAPIKNIFSLPLDGNLLAAVQMEPEGLQFATPVTLTFEFSTPPVIQNSLVGFSIQDDRTRFSLVPITLAGSKVTMQISHFTVAGLTDDDLDSYDELLKKFISFILNEYYGVGGVLDALTSVISCSDSSFTTAANKVILFQKHVSLFDDLPLGTGPIPCELYPGGQPCSSTKDLLFAARISLEKLTTNLFAGADQQCHSDPSKEADAIICIGKAGELSDAGIALDVLLDYTLIGMKTCGLYSLEIKPKEIYLSVNVPGQFEAFAQDKSGNRLTNRELKWTIDNPGIASLGASGFLAEVTWQSPGKTSVNVYDRLSRDLGVIALALFNTDSGDVKVGYKLEIRPKETTLHLMNTVELNAALKDPDGSEHVAICDWKSGTGKVATVNPSSGEKTNAHAVGGGTETITAKHKDSDLSATATITVPVKVTVTPDRATLVVNEPVTLTATMTDTVDPGVPCQSCKVTWSGGNAAVQLTPPQPSLTDPNGVSQASVKGGAVGSASVTVESGGTVATVPICVDMGHRTIQPVYQTVIVGGTVPFRIDPIWAQSPVVSWNVDLPSIASLSPTQPDLTTQVSIVGNLPDEAHIRASTGVSGSQMVCRDSDPATVKVLDMNGTWYQHEIPGSEFSNCPKSYESAICTVTQTGNALTNSCGAGYSGVFTGPTFSWTLMGGYWLYPNVWVISSTQQGSVREDGLQYSVTDYWSVNWSYVDENGNEIWQYCSGSTLAVGDRL